MKIFDMCKKKRKGNKIVYYIAYGYGYDASHTYNAELFYIYVVLCSRFRYALLNSSKPTDKCVFFLSLHTYHGLVSIIYDEMNICMRWSPPQPTLNAVHGGGGGWVYKWKFTFNNMEINLNNIWSVSATCTRVYNLMWSHTHTHTHIKYILNIFIYVYNTKPKQQYIIKIHHMCSVLCV